MAPLRRYIRLTPHTTIQALIFLEDPSILHTWLIRPANPALPRIIAALKDLILPKLLEERERERTATGSAKKKRAVKDVVVGTDFQVSVYFKDGATGHSLVMRRREMLGPKPEEGRLVSNSSKMVQMLEDGVMGDVGDVDNRGGGADNGQDDGSGLRNLRIENEDDDIDLSLLPLAEISEGVTATAEFEFSAPAPRTRRRTRARGDVGDGPGSDSYHQTGGENQAEGYATTPTKRGPRRNPGPTHRGRRKGKQKPQEAEEEEPEAITVDSGSESDAGSRRPTEEKKKKPLFRTSYEAHKIYGKVLCLIVKKIDLPQASTAPADDAPSVLVTRDIPIAPGIEETGATDDVMEGWMYMSQVIREDPDM
ncbi:hypothetical protein Dda_3076 [Drechslerella dactyloides]|uniref:Uncharacterized protein n=1 Tax=Drechslerella dactyloides TaxID=74499 RepID=A0AAD6NLF3_DREDA|nr:hypothetical protein Dda_3076 [Drechslerella dactyloides]